MRLSIYQPHTQTQTFTYLDKFSFDGTSTWMEWIFQTDNSHHNYCYCRVARVKDGCTSFAKNYQGDITSDRYEWNCFGTVGHPPHTTEKLNRMRKKKKQIEQIIIYD